MHMKGDAFCVVASKGYHAATLTLAWLAETVQCSKSLFCAKGSFNCVSNASCVFENVVASNLSAVSADMARAAAMQSRAQSDGTCELHNVVGSGRQCIHFVAKLHLQGANVSCNATELQ